jgi:hypothetical protein
MCSQFSEHLLLVHMWRRTELSKNIKRYIRRRADIGRRIYEKLTTFQDYITYCDMTLQNRNSLLLDNGSLRNKHTFQLQPIRLWKLRRCYEIDTRFYGDADSWRSTWYGTCFPCQRNEQKFPRTRTSNQHQHTSFVREFSVQLWSVHQRTTEAEEVTDS